MREFQQKGRRRKALLQKLAMLALLILLGFIIRGVVIIYGKAQQSKQELALAVRQESGLKEQDAQFQSESSYLKTSQGVEAEIRDKFDVSKQGEGVIVIVEKASDTPAVDNRNFMVKIWDSIRGAFGGNTATSSVVNKPQ